MPIYISSIYDDSDSVFVDSLESKHEAAVVKNVSSQDDSVFVDSLDSSHYPPKKNNQVTVVTRHQGQHLKQRSHKEEEVDLMDAIQRRYNIT